MQTLNLIQGTPEWLAHRATAFNASDAPAMLGLSKYKTRGQLLKERATGITPDVNDATQRLFNDGHRFEALARPLAEKIVGETLSPVTGTNGNFSASFDGITFDDSTIWEHKTLNADIRLAMGDNGNAGGLSEMLRVQMEHQLHVSGADKCLFSASKFDENDELLEEVHGWYMPDLVLRKRIIAGWAQFEKDLADYQHVEVIAAPQAEAIMGLPAVFVQATGMVTASNLPEFKLAAETFISNIKTDLVTDTDFANAEANVKFCKTAEDDLESAKKNMLSQTSSIDEVIRTIDFIKGQLASKRLMLDKLVKSEKESRKLSIVSQAGIAFSAHVEALESETRPIQLHVTRPDFAGAMKGLKKLSAMQDAVDTVLANGKIVANAVATDVRAKLAWCKENASGHSALFPDLQNLMSKMMEDFTLTITSRIEKQKADEAAKLEAERAKMQAEATAKAEREAAATLAAEEARIRAEERAKAEAERTPVIAQADDASRASERMAAAHRETAPEQDKPAPSWPFPVMPSRIQMIEVIAKAFNMSYSAAEQRMVQEFQSMKEAA